MENINNLIEGKENIGGDSFTCPKCGESQISFIDRGHGWVRCPTCDKGIQKRQIPEEYHHLFIKADSTQRVEKKDIKKPPQPVVRPKSQPLRDATPSGELFDRFAETWEILDQILRQFGVPDKTRDFMVKRAERQGTMQPQEVQRILNDMQSGMPKKQISYVAEEYYLALEAEEDKRRNDASSSSFPMYRTNRDNAQMSFPWRSGSQSPGQGNRVPAWDRNRGQQQDSFTPADFEREWNNRVEKLKQQEKIEDQNKTIAEMGNMLRNMEQQIANPPKPDDSNKFYQMFIEQERKSSEQMMLLINKMGEQRDSHNKELIELYKVQATKSSTSGYKEDNVRLVADAINSASGIIKDNKPLHTAVKSISQGQVQSTPPPGEEVALVEGADLGVLSRLRKNIIVDE